MFSNIKVLFRIYVFIYLFKIKSSMVSSSLRAVTSSAFNKVPSFYITQFNYRFHAFATWPYPKKWRNQLTSLFFKIDHIIYPSSGSFFFSFCATAPIGPGPPFTSFLGHTQRPTTVVRTPLDERSARRSNLYWQHTTLTSYKHTCPRWDLNPQSQQASGRRPTP